MADKGPAIRDEKDRTVFCPLGQGEALCIGKYYSITCAWWIPGAECCALVQIARKLNSITAMLQTKYDFL